MKRLFLIALAVCAVLLFSTAGAEPKFLAEYNEATGTSQVYLSGLSGSTDYSVMLLRTEGSLETDNILFLDQVRSTTYGTVQLTFVQTGLDGAVLAVGGPISGSSSPCVLGTVRGTSGGSIILPNALNAVEDEAFMGSSVQYVYLGSRVQRIGNKAFAQCDNLTAIHIPDSVTDIAEDAFQGSSQVKIVCSPDSAACSYAVRKNIPYILQ